MMLIKLRIREKAARAYLSGADLLKAPPLQPVHRHWDIAYALISSVDFVSISSPSPFSILDDYHPTCCTKFALPIMVGTMITV
jgi:hypothetical protein